MNILVLSHMYPNKINPVYGIFVHEQVKELVRQGCEVRVISPVAWTPFPIKYLSAKWKAHSEIPLKQNWEGIEVYYPRYLSFPQDFLLGISGWLCYYGMKSLIFQIYKDFKFRLIHAHAMLPSGYTAMILRYKYNKPVVLTIHGVDAYFTIYKYKKTATKILKGVNKIIAVSSVIKRILSNYIKPDKIAVINNGIPTEKIFFGKSTLKNKYLSKKVILSVGNLIEQKGHMHVLKALKKLAKKYQETIYLIIGIGPEEKKLRKYVVEYGLSQNVKFLGQIPHQKVMEYMSVCDMFVLSSWNEGFGVVYIEAMAHGKPVIACKGEGIEDVITDKETGLLVNSKDADSLVDAFDFLLSHPEKAQEIGEKGKRTVLENYTWSKNVQKNIEIYGEF